MKDILCKPPSNAAFSSQVVTDGSAVLQGNCSGTSLLSRRATTKHNCSRRSGMGAFLQANCPVGSSGLVPSELPIRERHETHVASEWRSLISSLATFQQHDSVIWWRYRSGGNSFLERIRQVPWLGWVIASPRLESFMNLATLQPRRWWRWWKRRGRQEKIW